MPIYAIHIVKTICETMEIEADSPEEAENIYNEFDFFYWSEGNWETLEEHIVDTEEVPVRGYSHSEVSIPNDDQW